MIPELIIQEISCRITANNGRPILVSQTEIDIWPQETIEAFKNYHLFEKAPPAKNTICQGCEQSCLMPVNIVNKESGHTSAFIVCDKRDDINRVPVPMSQIEQWQISCYSIAKSLALVLNIEHTQTLRSSPDQWEIGVLKRKHSSHIVLTIKEHLTLSLAGHSVLLSEILSIENSAFKVDKKRLLNLVDNPIDGGGNDESASARKIRLMGRKAELIKSGHHNYIQIIAKEESVSTRWIHKLLERYESNHA